MLSWPVALGCLLTTLVPSVLAAVSRAPGEIIAPVLTIGGALELLVNALAHAWLVHIPPTWVVAGMGAFLSAVTRSPLSSVIISLELAENGILYHPQVFSSVGRFRGCPSSLHIINPKVR
jgi:CIC family chloride channel protein